MRVLDSRLMKSFFHDQVITPGTDEAATTSPALHGNEFA